MTSSTTFTGSVTARALATPSPGSSLAVYVVRFASRARTHWHAHPRGQGLYVAEGLARVQIEGAPVREIAAGGDIWIPAGARHWHGAGDRGPMTHIAYQEADGDGMTVHWYEPVSDSVHRGTRGEER